MTRLRWTTYDKRGLAWRRARTRFLVAVLIVALAVVSGLTSVAEPGRAEDSGLTPTADLTLLAQRLKAEQRALAASYETTVRGISAERDAELGGIRAQLLIDIGQQRTAAGVRAQERAARRTAALGAVGDDSAAAEQALLAGIAQQRAAIASFFNGLIAGLGPVGGTPSRTALDAAKKQLEGRRSIELQSLSAAHSAEYGELERRLKEAVASVDGQLDRLDAEHAGLQKLLDAGLARVKQALAADLEATRTAIDLEIRAVKARHAQELLDLEQLHETQLAASTDGARHALEDEQGREVDELKAMHAAELVAQATAKKDAEAAESTARHAAEDQHSSDRSAEGAEYTLTKTVLAAAKSLASGAANTKLAILDDGQALRYASVKVTYDTAISGIGKGVVGLTAARVERLAKHEVEAARAVEAVIAAADVRRKDVRRGYDEQDAQAARRLKNEIAAAERVSRQELDRAGWKAKQALGRAARDYDRQLRLLASEYFTLRIRGLAFLERSDTYASVGAAFDPTSDPGSLYNVARRIGVLDLPAGVTGKGIGVALIDTGVVDAPGLADADVEIGPDFSFEDVVPELRGRDTMGHGTHLAGIINARDAGWTAGDRERRPDRLLGIAPDARLVSVKAGAADGAVDVTQIIAAINWVIDNKDKDGRNIRVLNLSFGTDGVQDYQVDPLSFAVERAWRAGIVVVVAAGNDGWAAAGLTNPARDPLVIAVGSSQTVNGKEDVPSGYTNGTNGGRQVDLSAPGRSIVSVRTEGARSDERNEAGRVGQTLVRGSGTSQAAAVTSGAAALLLSARPALTPDQVKHLLMTGAKRPDTDDVGLAGAGYLRIDNAVDSTSYGVPQQWVPATGSGTLDGARGSVRVAQNGVVLEGEFDIFGRSWSGSRWTTDAWSGSRWTGSRWTESAWSGSRWTGAGWSGDLWAGASWSGSRWTTDLWTGSRWTGSRWTSDAFTGSRWTGSGWTAGGWFGVGWDDGPAAVATVGLEAVSAEAVAGPPAP